MRILNYPRLLAVIGLCSLANLAGLSVDIGNLSFISFALAQPAALTTPQSDALNAYNKIVQADKYREPLLDQLAGIGETGWPEYRG